MKVVISQALKNVVITAEGLKNDRDPRKDKTCVEYGVIKRRGAQQDSGDDDNDHHDRFRSQKANAFHTDLNVFVAISFQHQIKDLITEKVGDKQQRCKKNQIITTDPHTPQPIGRKKNQGREVQQGSDHYQ